MVCQSHKEKIKGLFQTKLDEVRSDAMLLPPDAVTLVSRNLQKMLQSTFYSMYIQKLQIIKRMGIVDGLKTHAVSVPPEDKNGQKKQGGCTTASGVTVYEH